MRRREALRTLLAFAASGIGGSARSALVPGFAALTPGYAGLTHLGHAEAFDFAQLKGRARALASAPFQPRVRPFPEALRRLDWDRYNAIRFRDDHALWADDRLRFQAKFFRAGDGQNASFTANVIVSRHDIAPDIPGVQNTWIQNVGCGTALVAFGR